MEEVAGIINNGLKNGKGQGQRMHKMKSEYIHWYKLLFGGKIVNYSTKWSKENVL